MSAGLGDVPTGGVRGATRQVLPFALATSAVPLTGLVGRGVVATSVFVIGIVLMALILPMVVLLQVHPGGTMARWAVLGATFAALALMLQGIGGADTGGMIVLLLPVVWMALYERRTQVIVALGLESMASVALHAVDPVNPFSAEDVRRIVVFLAVSSLTAWAIGRLVAQLARSERVARKGLETLAAVTAAARAIRESDDARTTACEAARAVTGASSVFLLEADGPDHLVLTAAAGAPLEPVRITLTERSVSGLAFRDGTPRYVGDIIGDPQVNRRLLGLTGARSLLAQPFSHGGETRGVVVASWQEPYPESAPESLHTLTLLAEEFGSALERMDLDAALEHRATTDPLTGMANRRVWREALPGMMTSAGSLSVALLDLDHFKTYNDSRGHLAGDAVLSALGRSWLTTVRPEDLLVRWGGEEFALALPDCPIDLAVEVIDRLRARVPEGLSASAGLALWNGTETIEGLLARVDAALYEAKRTGRDRTVVADDEVGVGNAGSRAR